LALAKTIASLHRHSAEIPWHCGAATLVQRRCVYRAGAFAVDLWRCDRVSFVLALYHAHFFFINITLRHLLMLAYFYRPRTQRKNIKRKTADSEGSVSLRRVALKQ